MIRTLWLVAILGTLLAALFAMPTVDPLSGSILTAIDWTATAVSTLNNWFDMPAATTYIAYALTLEISLVSLKLALWGGDKMK